jgi:hypothetical protein
MNYISFYIYNKKMTTVTIKISTKSKKAKHLIGLIEEMAKTDKGIYETTLPNSITQKAMDEAEKGKVKRAKSVDDLFNSI